MNFLNQPYNQDQKKEMINKITRNQNKKNFKLIINNDL